MKSFMKPGSCSTGVRILLEEIGLVFEAHVVNPVKGDHLKPECLAINPNGTITTLLRDDDVALIDFLSIANWLADAYPRRKLLPETEDARRSAIATMHFCLQHIRGEGFRRVFTPERYAARPSNVEAIKAEGRKIVAYALIAVDTEPTGRDYVAGGFSIAEAALFHVEFRADKVDMAPPRHCWAH